MMPVRCLRRLSVLLLTMLLLAPGTLPAQEAQPSPSGSNPTAMSANEQQLLQELGKLQGRVTLPYQHAGVLQQPQGRSYQMFHEAWLPWIGAILILATIVALAAFYVYRGRIRLREGELTGRKILRFNAFERLTHWMTATSFIVLAISGLNYIFGKRLLMPLLGADTFATWSQWAKYAHNFLAWPFMLGIILMFVLWVRDNIPDKYDIPWFKAGGGLVGNREPIAGRFNAGQKLVFWSVVLGGILMSASGLMLLFPLALLDVNGMQIAQYVHAGVGIALIALILGHIYIGSIGMEGAYGAMGTGEIDLSWAMRHHRAWVEEQRAKGRIAVPPADRRSGRAAPAE